MRILAGEFKGRSLLSPPPGGTTRPITGSVKKSLFGMLGERLDGWAVLDLYCGTGSLGLEALSRGADICCFAERDRRALDRLKRNIDSLGIGDKCAVWTGDLTSQLGGRLVGLHRPIDLAFVDPPYAQVRQWSWPHVAEVIFSPIASSLGENGAVALRVPGKVAVPERLGGLVVIRLRHYGDMTVALLKAEQAAPTS